MFHLFSFGMQNVTALTRSTAKAVKGKRPVYSLRSRNIVSGMWTVFRASLLVDEEDNMGAVCCALGRRQSRRSTTSPYTT